MFYSQDLVHEQEEEEEAEEEEEEEEFIDETLLWNQQLDVCFISFYSCSLNVSTSQNQ